MRTDHQTESVSLTGLFQPIISKLLHLTQLVQQRGKISAEVQQISDLLETLPLSSDEFGVACNRLRSAKRYLQASEGGAANWELNMLRQNLRRWLDREAPEPRMRDRHNMRHRS